MITWRGLGPPQREPAPCEGRLPRQFSEYMANTHMAKANKYQVHRKGGKVANNVFFAELALMGGWRHLARESLLRFCQSCSSMWLSYNENEYKSLLKVVMYYLPTNMQKVTPFNGTPGKNWSRPKPRRGLPKIPPDHKSKLISTK